MPRRSRRWRSRRRRPPPVGRLAVSGGAMLKGFVSVRPAALGDAAAIAEVHVASWRETYAGLLPDGMLTSLDVAARRLWWTSRLSSASGDVAPTIFVAESEEGVAGFGACGAQRAPDLAEGGYTGEIGAIYVIRAAQGRGAGRALMRRLAAALEALGHGGASLWVLRDNLPARRFYERLGGAVVGERVEVLEHGPLGEVAYGWRDVKDIGV